jgi:hypothetical protein
MLKAMHEQGEQAREELRKERDARLDDAAAVEFEKAYAGLGLDAKAMGPAMRKFAAVDEASATIVREALTKAQTLNTGARAVIVKEIGRVAAPTGDGPLAQVETMAKAMVSEGKSPSIEQARAAVYKSHPDLYDAARNAGGE